MVKKTKNYSVSINSGENQQNTTQQYDNERNTTACNNMALSPKYNKEATQNMYILEYSIQVKYWKAK